MYAQHSPLSQREGGGKSMMCYKDAKASEETDSLLLTDWQMIVVVT